MIAPSTFARFCAHLHEGLSRSNGSPFRSSRLSRDRGVVAGEVRPASLLGRARTSRRSGRGIFRPLPALEDQRRLLARRAGALRSR